MKLYAKLLLSLMLLSFPAWPATWGKWDNTTVGATTGNIGKWNGVAIGTSTGNIGIWNALVSPSSGGGSTVTINLGQMASNPADTDSGNSLLLIAEQFTTPTPSSGGLTVTGYGTFLSSPAASNWGLAIYTDSAGSPSTLVSGCVSFSSSTPSSPVATLSASGCSLSAATKYWVAFTTASSAQKQALTGAVNCDSGQQTVFSNSPLGSFTSSASWPSSFPASSLGGECAASYVTLQYSTTSHYVLASSGTALCGGGTSCLIDIAPFGTGHGLFAGSAAADLTGVNPLVSSFADSASDTITKRGTCGGSLTHSTALCGGSADVATAGTNTLTVNYAGTTLQGVFGYAETIGTASSSSFDVAHYDLSLEATPFTSGTATTTQAAEIMFGIASNSLGTGSFTAGSGWTMFGQTSIGTGNVLSGALFYQITTTTGAYSLLGSYSVSGTNNLPALMTFK